MNLKELQAMIKEELDAYMNEEGAVAEVDVDVDADDVDAGAEGGDNSEDMLRQIYDMLKGKFEAEEGGEEAEDMDEADMDEADMDEADMDEDMMDEAKKEEMDEAKKDEMDEGKKDEEDMKEEVSAEATHLQERFQKLANIIK